MIKFLFIIPLFLLITLPSVFGDSDRDAKFEFAGTLEETLGHFWALELNLDEKNSKLALIHATHPISELYDTMQEHLSENPDFNAKLEETLMDLQNKANTDVTREDAQIAIDEAQDIIEEARTLVVGKELSQESEFKMQLINGLLETAKVEYNEAVENGMIKEMAEFQDGSSFLWRSQQIFNDFSETLDPIDSSRINELYSEAWVNFNSNSDSSDVENILDAIIYEFEELSGIPSVQSEHEEELFSNLPPLKQIDAGVDPDDIICKEGLELIFAPNSEPACVKPNSISRLISFGWNQ